MDDVQQGGSGGWDQAVSTAAAPVAHAVATAPGGGATQPATPAAAQPATQASGQTSAPAQAAAPPPQVTTVPQPPPNAAPVRPGGLRGFVDKMLDGLAGTDTSRIRQDADGNVYLQHDTPTRGQQWMKIASEAIHGAAAGYSAGRGQGNEGKALAAGVQAGADVHNQETQEQNQQLVQLANITALNHETAANALKMANMKMEMGEHNIEFSQKQQDRLAAAGAQHVGHVENLQELTKFMRDTPNFMQDQVKGAMYTPVATFSADGKANGFDIYKKVPGSDEEVVAPGADLPFFNPVKNQIEYQKSSGPMKRSDVNAVWAAAGNAQHKYQIDDAEIKEKTATAESKLHPPAKTETPSETTEHYAAANAHNAQAALDRTRQKQIETGKVLPDGLPNPRFETMAKALLDGDLLPSDLKREAKGASLDPNEVIGRAMEMAKETGQHFSLPIIEQEHKFASSPKTQAALDGIDRVLGSAGTPGYMDQMLNLAKKADLGTMGAYNSASLAVKRWWGNNEAKNFQTAVMETRRSIAGLIGNPLLGGSETDKKLKQADEMLGESPTLHNLEGAAQILKQALATQRNSIVSNNRYLRQRYGTAPGQPGQQPAAQPGAMVTVKLANGQTGHIPAQNLQKFQTDNPGATVMNQ